MDNSIDSERKNIDFIDRQIARLFSERMKYAENIALIKAETGAPVFDPEREKIMLERESEFVPEKLRTLYGEFLGALFAVSKKYQNEIISSFSSGTGESVPLPNSLEISTKQRLYKITIKRGAIKKIGEIFPLNRKVLIVTDDGVPEKYVETVASKCEFPYILKLRAGEKSKNTENVAEIEKTMLDNGFSRSDCVVAVGGGVVGDIAGFSASIYMRGIDFYNIPTTLLSQVDSSIGGKTAVNFCGTKNIIGSFKQPNGVLIDPELLLTLNKSQMSSGIAECIKCALLADEQLLNIIESGVTEKNIDTVIYRTLCIKKKIVELDENENGERRALNLGHTVGHAIEMQSGFSHGESVALGILPMVSEDIRCRLLKTYENLGLRTKYDLPCGTGEIIARDKKLKGGKIVAVTVDKVGEYKFTPMTAKEAEQKAREVLSR